jgi:uncharacterized protein YbjT (DUF2867 family)
MAKTILIAGATGQTGRLLTKDLLNRGHAVIALVRDGSDVSVLPDAVTLRQADLTDLQPGVCEGADVVIFAAGSGSKTGPEMTEKVDRQGAMRLVDLAKDAGVERFVMLSAIGADQSDPSGDIAHYIKAKHDADEHLKASGLTYAILRPVRLTNHGRSADIVLGDDVDPKATVSRSDVAHLLADAATTGEHDGKALDMQAR